MAVRVVDGRFAKLNRNYIGGMILFPPWVTQTKCTTRTNTTVVKTKHGVVKLYNWKFIK